MIYYRIRKDGVYPEITNGNYYARAWKITTDDMLVKQPNGAYVILGMLETFDNGIQLYDKDVELVRLNIDLTLV
jgi:hypothetical protein